MLGFDVRPVVTDEMISVLLKISPDAMFLYDFKGSIIDGNQIAEQLVGYKKEELVGKNFLQHNILPRSEIPKVVRDLGESIFGRPVGPKHYKVNRKDGIQIDISLRAYSFKHKGKDVILAVFRDITERNNIERGLRISEEKYRLLFEHMVNGIAYHKIITDKKGVPVDYVYLEVNTQFENLTGMSRADILGKHASDVIPCFGLEDPNRVERYGKVAQDRSSINFESYFPNINKWFNIKAYSTTEDHFYTVFEDITDRKRDAERLDALHRYSLSLSLANSMDEIANETLSIMKSSFNCSIGDFQVINEGYLDTFDHFNSRISEKELIGHDRRMLLTGKGITTKAAREEKTILVNDLRPNQDYVSGISERSMSELAVPIIIKNKAMGVLNVESILLNAYNFTDVKLLETLALHVSSAIERIRSNEDRENMEYQLMVEKVNKEHVEELDRIKTDFMRTATHEIRTPITSIKGYTELMDTLVKRTENPTLSKYLEVVSRNIERLEHLSNDLLDIQRIESGRMVINRSQVDVGSLVSQVSDELTPILNERKQSLQLYFPYDELVLNADSLRLLQVLINLVSNASNYSPKESEISLKVTHTGNSVLFSIGDKGAGLKREDISKLFVPFPDIQMTDYQRGSGLGLSICKGIVDLHKGSIGVYSDGPGCGATFEFEIPC